MSLRNSAGSGISILSVLVTHSLLLVTMLLE